jgi:hypothetical protein
MVDGDLSKEPNAGKDPYYPASAVTFFSKTADAQLTFKVDARGRASELVFTFGGGRTNATSVFPDACHDSQPRARRCVALSAIDQPAHADFHPTRQRPARGHGCGPAVAEPSH